MKKTVHHLKFSALPKTYTDLCHFHIPRPIHDKVGYENTLEIVEAMAGFEDQFTRDQNDYFDILSDLVMDYDEQHNKWNPTSSSVIDRLKYLMESANWNASDLGRFLGLDVTMGNKILRGERHLTTDHIKKLSEYFHLSSDYLI